MQSNKTMIAIAAVIAGALSMTTMSQAFADDNNGLIVPLYGWSAGWEDVIDAKQENDGTRIIAIINPSNGPGGSKDSHWADVVDDLQDADIKVVGYSATSYAGRSQDDIEDDIDDYYDWYDLDGIFLDEVSPSNEGYYEDIRHYAEKPEGSQLVILNPGSPVPESYEDAGDIIIVYENFGLPSDVDSNGISESKLGAIGHGGIPSESEFKDLSDNVKYLYEAPDWLSAASNIEEQADWAD